MGKSDAVTADAIEEALKRARGLPVPVESWRVEVGPDASGKEAVWVWIRLRHEDLRNVPRARLRELVREVIRRKTGEAGIPEQPQDD